MISKKGNRMVNSRNYLGNVSRTKVSNDYVFRTTFKSGRLFPIYASDVLPSETKSISCGELVRSITPLGPTMDNSFLDIFFFFVPKRLVWDHWEEFIAGYNKEAWAQDVEYTVPKIIFDYSHWESEDPSDNAFLHSFLDYLPGACDVVEIAKFIKAAKAAEALQTGDGQKYMDAVNETYAIDALYPRAYVKIWNDWWRDENLQDELELYTGDTDETAEDFCNGTFSLLSDIALPSSCKYHNRFTSALPAPQKGPDVLIPMNDLPVGITPGANVTLTANVGFGFKSGETLVKDKFQQGSSYGSGLSDANAVPVFAKNVSNTIRMLNLSYQTEMLLSKDGSGGTRYIESLLSHFGVHNGDARLQRSEYLGSRHIPLSVMQITNTAASSGNPLGSVGGQSVTKDNAHYFTKSFSEHGILLGLATVRTNISYSSGVRKQYQRFTRFEHIWPEFKHIGDVPIYTKELVTDPALIPFGLGSADVVFGYTPYGSELREGYNYNNGLFRQNASGSLSYLTYQEDFQADFGDTVPILSEDYIKQPTNIIGRTLVSQEGPQFYALFSIHEERIIPLDPTSDFSLIGHY